MRNMWPLSVHCPECKRVGFRMDLIQKEDVIAFKVACECGVIISFAKKDGRVTALKQLSKEQRRLDK